MLGYVVLFQIKGRAAGKVAERDTLIHETLVRFISFALANTKTGYRTTEKECLDVVGFLEGVRWLVKERPYQSVVYADHMALKPVLGAKSDATGRISRW